MELPKQYNSKESESKWLKYWEDNEIYKFDKSSDKEIFSIDTPPPTVSGKMHIGHAFMYSQMDFVARFQRMNNKSVFYPFGTDDNGFATERLIEKLKNVKHQNMERDEFKKLCLETLEKELRPAYIRDWKNIGLSTDFSLFYTTINDHCQKISQKSFLDLQKAGLVYRTKAPMMICPHCHTAIAQVELTDVENESHLNHIEVEVETGDKLVFATTRPELIYGCVGISVHPDDKRYKHLIGKLVAIPITGAKIPLTADEATDMEYGSGVVYYCTYGGVECIDWLTRHPDVKPINVMGLDGTYNELSGPYKGMTSKEARIVAIEDLKKAGVLIKQEKIKHMVNTHERCGTEIEFVATEQWFLKYLDKKEMLLKAADELNWYPAHMKNRYDNWVKGLKWDWCLSRQRFFGVPLPVWYDKKSGKPIFADEKQLPVDPLKDLPKGYTKNDIIPEEDVMDTWATSSLTPQIAASLVPEMYDKLYPMTLRPQAHDIITFWLFNTVVKSQLHNNINPWKDCIISGWALDPKGKKMSKSKGNVIEPQVVIEKHSADVLRFWAAGSKLGEDLAFSEKDIQTAHKTVVKLWNASKFSFMHLADYKLEKPKKLEGFDKWMLSKLYTLVKNSKGNFESYQYSKVKQEVEYFFWHKFCDNYLEISKDRLYNPDKRGDKEKLSAQYTLYNALLAIIKMNAPIMPFITEELYQHFFKTHEKSKSIHITNWPECDDSMIDSNIEKAGDVAVEIIAAVRQAKNQNQKSLKEPIKKLTIQTEAKLDDFIGDLKATTRAESIVMGDCDIEVSEGLKIGIEF